MKEIDDREQSNGEGGGGYSYPGNTSNSSLIYFFSMPPHVLSEV